MTSATGALSTPGTAATPPERPRAVIADGFDHLGLRRIEASCFPENAASACVLEKTGMTYERTLPAHVQKDGVLRDIDVYAIERPDTAGEHGDASA